MNQLLENKNFVVTAAAVRKKVFLTAKTGHRGVDSINAIDAARTLCPCCIIITHCTDHWKPRTYTYKYFLATQHKLYNAQYMLQIYSVVDWHNGLMPQHLIRRFLVEIPDVLGQALGPNLVERLLVSFRSIRQRPVMSNRWMWLSPCHNGPNLTLEHPNSW